MGSSVSGVGVVDKAMAILGAVEQSPRSLGELVEATGYSRATAHRLAVALEVHGLIRRDEDGRFTLGVRLIALGRAAAEGIPLAEAAMAALTRLRDETGESVQLYVREGDRRVCIAALESPHGLRTIVPMGASLPLDVGSAGAILSQPLGAESVPNRRRWAESVGEREAGVASVSAGVLDPDGAAVAAVSVSGPIERTTRQPGARYGDAVVAAARSIEQAAGLTGGQGS
ncbi:MAG: IclR family transcriptional regulator [Acidimicrobiales bacterium]